MRDHDITGVCVSANAYMPCLSWTDRVGVVHDLEFSASGRARVRTGLCGENLRHPPEAVIPARSTPMPCIHAHKKAHTRRPPTLTSALPLPPLAPSPCSAPSSSSSSAASPRRSACRRASAAAAASSSSPASYVAASPRPPRNLWVTNSVYDQIRAHFSRQGSHPVVAGLLAAYRHSRC